ncbi:MAG TPA: prolyl oligopeptidase family serine peptidase [Bryobacteraceae bacterium]|jgi:dipeptidyl-peptidase-4
MPTNDDDTLRLASDFFPREYAETLNYSLGAPRTFRVSKDGERVFFLRSDSPVNRALDLWMMDMRTGEELLLVAISNLSIHTDYCPDPAAEKLRKERLREASSGITSYAIDSAGGKVAFGLGGFIYVHFLAERRTITNQATTDAVEVKISPDGNCISFVSQGAVFIANVDGTEISNITQISPSASSYQTWGLPDFIAAEEMHRNDGHWWSPDSRAVIFEGVDVEQMRIWHISNPTDPALQPRATRYPQAGSPNAELSLRIWRRDGSTTRIRWDNSRFPYLVGVRWRGSQPTIVVQDRSQKHVSVLAVDAFSGEVDQVYAKFDALWVELVEGVPAWSHAGQLIDAPDDEKRVLRLGSDVYSRGDLELRAYVGELSSGGLVYVASRDPRDSQIWLSVDSSDHRAISPETGVFSAEIGGNTVVVFGSTLERQPNYCRILQITASGVISKTVHSAATDVRIAPSPNFRTSSTRQINYAILYPRNFRRDRLLPTLLDPYGGPWVQKCVSSSLAYTQSQWFADQGFAVIVADGRGTPGRGRAWEKAVAGDLINPIVEDQIEVLDDAIKGHEFIDKSRVAIRGWSFGGYLAAFAIMKAPERLHAAIAGAPVSDWRYYDTHYSERYLGDPIKNSETYDACSVLHAAVDLRRPLLLIHGFEDDNVFCSHSLRLSKALFDAQRPHYFLPLTGITHMTSSGNAAESLLRIQLAFLNDALDIRGGKREV